MNTLQAGFARVDITPEKGVAINGYFIPRAVETVLDRLEVNCLALGCGEKKLLLLAADKRLKMDDYAESYRASGAQLGAGVRLHRSFIGTGYSDKMHMQGDFSAMLFVITED